MLAAGHVAEYVLVVGIWVLRSIDLKIEAFQVECPCYSTRKRPDGGEHGEIAVMPPVAFVEAGGCSRVSSVAYGEKCAADEDSAQRRRNNAAGGGDDILLGASAELEGLGARGGPIDAHRTRLTSTNTNQSAGWVERAF